MTIVYIVGYNEDGEFNTMGETRFFFDYESAERSLRGKKIRHRDRYPYEQYVDDLFIAKFVMEAPKVHKPIDIIYISEYIVTQCMNMDKPITNLYLQKVLYMIEREHIKLYGHSLFNKDISAWKFGAVFEDVYYHYSDYGSMEIITLEENDGEDLSNELREIIDAVINKVINLQPYELVELLQFKGSAWDMNYGIRKSTISTQDILEEINRIAQKI